MQFAATITEGFMMPYCPYTARLLVPIRPPRAATLKLRTVQAGRSKPHGAGVQQALRQTAPLLAVIRGRMGGSVYYMRGTRQCRRRHVIPSNPRTRRQQKGRNLFREAVQRWQALDERARARWNVRAAGMNMSGYNLFISHAMKQAREAAASRVYAVSMRTRKPAPFPVILLHKDGAQLVTVRYHYTLQRAGPWRGSKSTTIQGRAGQFSLHRCAHRVKRRAST